MALKPAYLADKSALARMSIRTVRERLQPLLTGGRIATCGIVDLELGYSARNALTHHEIVSDRRSMPLAPINDAVFTRALEVQGLLADQGHHRLPVPDLIIAACAEAVGLTVLHYDAGFERIAAVTGQPETWVAPRGTL